MARLQTKGVIFDFDGTLVESTSVKEAAFYSLYEPYGPEIASAVLEHHRLHGGVNRFEKFRTYNMEFLGLPDPTELIESQAREFASRVVAGVIEANEVPGVTRFLDHCRKRSWLCAIDSATPTGELRHIVAKRGWGDSFDIVLGSPSSKFENLIAISEAWRIEPSSLLFFGDAREDRLAAEKAGACFVGIGGNTGATISFPDFNTYLMSVTSDH
jgi:phosphoglycolate phosphatase-like HAD superfamily hydrolase